MFRRYDDPRSHFTRRLAVVQRAVHGAIERVAPGPVVVLDVCSGAGRVVLPVIADHPRRRDVRATLIDLDRPSIAAAGDTARHLGLDNVRIVEGDAGASSVYDGLERADVVVLSGVLAHLSNHDRAGLLRFLPQIARPGAALVWTIGWRWDPTRIWKVRRTVTESGFVIVERRFVGYARVPRIPKHEVGVARLAVETEPLTTGRRIFSFIPELGLRHPRIRRYRRLFADAGRRGTSPVPPA